MVELTFKKLKEKLFL